MEVAGVPLGEGPEPFVGVAQAGANGRTGRQVCEAEAFLERLHERRHVGEAIVRLPGERSHECGANRWGIGDFCGEPREVTLRRGRLTGEEGSSDRSKGKHIGPLVGGRAPTDLWGDVGAADR